MQVHLIAIKVSVEWTAAKRGIEGCHIRTHFLENKRCAFRVSCIVHILFIRGPAWQDLGFRSTPLSASAPASWIVYP